MRFRSLFAIIILALSVNTLTAQSTTFSYQGNMNSGGTPANGNHDFEFALFDSLAGGSQLGSTLTKTNVAVANGVFAVSLDFGAQFPGANRFLEIRVRQSGGAGFTTLAPRQAVDSSPYSIKSLNAENAANAANATNASQLGGIAANQYVLTGDSRLSDARNPLPNNGNYIQNQNAAPQASSNFSISGNGTAGGTLSGNTINSQTHYNILGNRAFIATFSGGNTFAGFSTGENSTGNNNSFFGVNAGEDNLSGLGNSFFGSGAGRNNVSGNNNSFFGGNAGIANLGGGSNNFFGTAAGLVNTSGSFNSFFGDTTGSGNIDGINNSFFGRAAGNANTSGSNNSVFGSLANLGSGSLTFATAIGAGAVVSSSNTIMLGRAADTVQIPGGLNVTGTLTATLPAGSANYIQNQNAAPQASSNFNISGTGTANIVNAATQYNLGGNRILHGPGVSNLFVGIDSGLSNTTGSGNAFFGGGSGQDNVGGIDNAFFGVNTGRANTSGNNNSYFGRLAGRNTNTGSNNTMVGFQAGTTNNTGSSLTLLGANANVAADGLTFATAIGAGAVVSTSNTVLLGRPADTVQAPGNLNVAGTLTANGTGLTNLNASNISSGTLNNARLGVVPIVNGGTGSPTQNFVDLTTAQTIAGDKTFSNSVAAGGVTIGSPEATVVGGLLRVFSPSGLNIQIRETTNDIEGIFGANSSGILYGSMTADPVQIRTDNTTRIHIESGGDVGIGTSSPVAKLDVNGNIHLTGEVRRPATGTANMLPLAYGYVLGDGTVASGSGNFSVSEEQATGVHIISVPGENFGNGALGYTVLVTLRNTTNGFVPTTSTLGNDLVVIIRASDGSVRINQDFSFLIFKP